MSNAEQNIFLSIHKKFPFFQIRTNVHRKRVSPSDSAESITFPQNFNFIYYIQKINQKFSKFCNPIQLLDSVCCDIIKSGDKPNREI